MPKLPRMESGAGTRTRAANHAALTLCKVHLRSHGAGSSTVRLADEETGAQTGPLLHGMI